MQEGHVLERKKASSAGLKGVCYIQGGRKKLTRRLWEDLAPSPSPKGRGVPNGTKFAMIVYIINERKEMCFSL